MSTLKRVTVTVPSDVLKAADALARRLERSRSWVVTRAMRDLVAHAVLGRPAAVAVGEPATEPYGVRQAFEEAASSRLERDLALTPEERVRVSEEMARTVPDGRARPRFERVMQFDAYGDYLDWKRLAGLEP